MTASRTHWRLLIATVLALMAVAWIAPRFVRAPQIQENRVLAQKPAWPRRPEDFRAFRTAAEAYVADKFPVRPHLIGLLNRLRLAVGVTGSPRVIVGRDGWLFYDDDSHLGAARNDPPVTAPELRGWLAAMAGRHEALQARGIPYLVVAPPVKEALYPQFGPAWYSGPNDDRFAITAPRLAAAAGAGDVLYLLAPVAEATRAGQLTFSRHDTHWTGYGAYAGYVGLLERLHSLEVTDEPRPMTDFESVGGSQKRRPRDLAKMLGVTDFVAIDYPRIENPQGMAKLKVTYLSNRRDWTAPQIWETGEVGKPVLLMIRDSFSNEFMPMMISHFSRIVLAHNQDGFWRPDLVDRFKPDVVVLEVFEPGLRIAMRDGPEASAAAMERIDRALAISDMGADPMDRR